MADIELIEMVNDNISSLEQIISHTKNELIKAHYQGQLYAFKLVLEKIKYVYLKINSNVFRLLAADYYNKSDNPSVFEVMVWKDDLSFTFESNVLSNSVLENYEIYSFKAYDKPDELIDPQLTMLIKSLIKEMTKEDLLKLLDCQYIYVTLHGYGDISDYFIATLEIDKLTSTGIVVKENEYEITFVPYRGFNRYWAMNKEDLE